MNEYANKATLKPTIIDLNKNGFIKSKPKSLTLIINLIYVNKTK